MMSFASDAAVKRLHEHGAPKSITALVHPTMQAAIRSSVRTGDEKAKEDDGPLDEVH